MINPIGVQCAQPNFQVNKNSINTHNNNNCNPSFTSVASAETIGEIRKHIKQGTIISGLCLLGDALIVAGEAITKTLTLDNPFNFGIAALTLGGLISTGFTVFSHHYWHKEGVI